MRRALLTGTLAAATLALHVSAASAAPSVQYGIHDDAWVASGPGTLSSRLDRLQSLGVTIVRCLLVPSLMAVLGRWNWWLPRPLARVVRVPPSALPPAAMPARR